ncbi:hypothetical protein HYH03_002155 [Edaphochlamys debaryana]|uniref:HIRAN domain-containing protein n=1 Tax=Edaphochlamys debaryana TaxID=47281 RepID=A0A835YLH0_9CHLO|nr:hypothetical protein HYH03_002155 [Edaphochlamys debaryana]|eukprot:KAG2499864.1 hypothetical protein HYH03_002155 [Edaphochlamys debaryana]
MQLPRALFRDVRVVPAGRVAHPVLPRNAPIVRQLVAQAIQGGAVARHARPQGARPGMAMAAAEEAWTATTPEEWAAAKNAARRLPPSQEREFRLMEDLRNERERGMLAEAFPVRGVTFGGRQANLQELQPGQSVLLEPEPNNPYDQHAVQVLDLRGRPLGYVPRDNGLNARLTQKGWGRFASVDSVGRADGGAGPFGARVIVRTGLPDLVLSPERIFAQDRNGYGYGFPPERWGAFNEAALSMADWRCEVTGVDQTQIKLDRCDIFHRPGPGKAVQLVKTMVVATSLALAVATLEQMVVEEAKRRNDAGEAPGGGVPPSAPERVPGSGGPAEAQAEVGRKAEGGPGSGLGIWARMSEAVARMVVSPEGGLFAEVNGLTDEAMGQYLEMLVERMRVEDREENWEVTLMC